MNSYLCTGVLTFLGTIAFLLLMSPTLRKEIVIYFDLFSEYRKKRSREMVRVNLYLSSDAYEALDKLKKLCKHSSMQETVVTALKFYLTVKQTPEKGE